MIEDMQIAEYDDEVRRLRAENERLREAVTQALDYARSDPWSPDGFDALSMFERRFRTLVGEVSDG